MSVSEKNLLKTKDDNIKGVEQAALIRDIKIANATSRGKGAIGSRAVVPRLVLKLWKDGESVLDFGAGKHAVHAKILKEKGIPVTAYEFGNNINPELHDATALNKKYDFVYASNVINVQNSITMLRKTINEIYKATKVGGRVILNLPATPRKGAYDGMTHGKSFFFLMEELLKVFSTVAIIDNKNKVLEILKK